MKNKFIYLSIAVILVLGRLIPHPWNMTPTLALGLYCSRWFSTKHALLLTLAGFTGSDILLALIQHHAIWGSWSLWTYSGLLGITVLGRYCQSTQIHQNLLLVLSSSLIYWLWTNFGCWLTMSYTPNLAGLLSCYTLALPFLKNQIIGNSIWFLATFYATTSIQHYRRQPS